MLHLEDFTQKYSISLHNSAIELCERAAHIMQNSKDPVHAYPHVLNILKELDDFLNKEYSVNQQDIDFNILLPAIFWHDSWKSTQEQTKSLLVFIYQQIMDGFGSARMMKPVAKELGISRDIRKAIQHAILRHSHPLFLFPSTKRYIWTPKTLEGKILRDLDFLDSWHLKRFKTIKEHHLKLGNTEEYVKKIGLWWINNVMKRTNGTELFFEFSLQKFKRRKDKMMAEIEKLLSKEHIFMKNK